MRDSFYGLVNRINSAAVVFPKGVNFDQMAAGLGLYLVFSKLGKEVSVLSSEPPVVEFSRLVAVDKVRTEVGDRNLVIKFSGYPPENIEKVAYNLEDKEFRLSIIPKPGVSAPEKNQVIVSYSGGDFDAVFLIGGDDLGSFILFRSGGLRGNEVVHIGVNPLLNSGEYPNLISLVEGEKSCVSEVVADILREWQFELDADTASNLIMGIKNGTDNFTKNVSPQTFYLAAFLMERGARIPEELNKSNFPPGSIPSLRGGAPKSWFGPKIYKSSVS